VHAATTTRACRCTLPCCCTTSGRTLLLLLLLLLLYRALTPALQTY
jgi:hypothetical protein